MASPFDRLLNAQALEMERRRQTPTGFQNIGSALGNFARQKQALQLQERQRQQNLADQIELARSKAEIGQEFKQPSIANEVIQAGQLASALGQMGFVDEAAAVANKVKQVVQGGQGQSIPSPINSLQISQQPQISGSGKIVVDGQEYVPDVLKRTVSGNLVPGDLKRQKKSAAQEKREVEIGELEGQVKNLIDAFRDARETVSDVSNIGELGIGGRLAGKVAVTKGKLGFAPEANVFQDRLKAFATTVAKAAGEVRPTDRDIERFIGTLPTLEKNDEENEIIIQGLINDLRARGAKALWADRTKASNKAVKSGQTSSGISFTVEE